MGRTFFVLLTVSLDVFSFGITLGISKERLSFLKSLIFTAVSLLLFAVPLTLSGVVATFISSGVCYLINGVALLCLGGWYLGKYISAEIEKRAFLAKFAPCINLYIFERVFYNKNRVRLNMGLKSVIFCAVPVNLDAFFTALLIGNELGGFFEVCALYIILTFLALTLGHIVSTKLRQFISLNFSWVSGVLFILLGLLKIF